MAKDSEVIHSLYQITEWPLDLNHPVYKEYPTLKLGLGSSVQYYAEKLTPLVAEIIRANSKYSDWALTAAPCHQIPAAANLLCWDIYERLKRRSMFAPRLSLVNLKKAREDTVIENAKDFSNYHDYSKYTWEERLKLKRKHNFLVNKEDFRNRGIIFINDINVTGTGQDYIRQVFAPVYQDTINWVYIIDCDKSIGRNEPQLENTINNFKIKTVLDFAAILAREDIRHTAKCISKIFTYGYEELEQLLAVLNRNQKIKLWDAIQEEGLYHGDLFKEKIALLRANGMA